jgi:dihydroorotate dehydrogenase (NAD+) catalytic subunit
MGLKTGVRIGSIVLANPVMPASGTFGFGREMAAIWNVRQLGAIVSKGVTPLPREGNDSPRVAETASGMLNSVGLQNPGIVSFLSQELPFMLSLGIPVIVNAAGHSIEDYVEVCSLLDRTDVSVIELNLSCPNVRSGCMSIGTDPDQVMAVVRAAKCATRKPLWVKLTPNVTSIVEIALAAQEAGADAVSLINTLMGMQIDIRTRRPVLGGNTGGLSGPAVKPVAVRMVNEVSRAVRIPVIGMGGIQTGEDAIEFLMAGAVAVQVGTANLLRPTACLDIILEIERFMTANGIDDIHQIVGVARRWGDQ